MKYVRDALIATQIMVEIIARYNPIKLFLVIAALPLLIALGFFIAMLSFGSSELLIVAIISFFFALFILSLGFFASMFRER